MQKSNKVTEAFCTVDVEQTTQTNTYNLNECNSFMTVLKPSDMYVYVCSTSITIYIYTNVRHVFQIITTTTKIY